MPEYHYRCLKCGATLTDFRSIIDPDPGFTCMKCKLNMIHDYQAERPGVYAPLPFSDGGHINGKEHRGLTKKKERELLKRTGENGGYEMMEVDHKDPFFHQKGVGLWRK